MNNKFLKISLLSFCFIASAIFGSVFLNAASAKLIGVDGCCARFELRFNDGDGGGDWVFYPDYPNLTPVYDGNNFGGSLVIEHCYNGPGNYVFYFDQGTNGNNGLVEITDCEDACCADPTGVTMTPVDGSCDLVMACVEGYEGCHIESLDIEVTGPNGTFTYITSYSDCNYIGDFEPGETYEIRVRLYVEGCGFSDYSQVQTYVHEECVVDCCADPTGVTMTPVDGSCDLVMACVEGYEGCQIESLDIEVTGPNGTFTYITSYSDCNYIGDFEPGETYEIRVRMYVEGCGFTEYSQVQTYVHEECVVDCCADPTGVIMTPVEGDCELVMACVEGYEGCQIESLDIEVTGPNGTFTYITSYSDCNYIGDFEPGETYEIRVRMYVEGCGFTEYSQSQTYVHEACVVDCCADPTGVTMTPVEGSCDLVMACVEGYEGCQIESLDIEVTGPNGTFTYITSYSDCNYIGDFEPGESYEIRVRMYVEGCGFTEYSQSQTYVHEACVVDCCADPTSVTLTPVEGNCDLVKVCIDGYEGCEIESLTIEVSETGTSEWTTYIINYTDCNYINFEEGVTYDIRTRLYVLSCGFSEYSEIQTYTHEGCVDCCVTPEADWISVEEVEEGRIQVCVQDAPCEGSIYYFRYRETSNSNWTEIGLAASCFFLNVHPCSTYEFQLSLFHADCGQSPYSSSQVFKTSGANCSDCCDAPKDISIDPIGDSCERLKICVNGYDECEFKYVLIEWAPFGSNDFVAKKSEEMCITLDGFKAKEGYTFRFTVNTGKCGDSKTTELTYKCFGKAKGNDARATNSLASPNPFSNYFEIPIQVDQSTDFTFTLMDLQGKIVRAEVGQLETGANNIALSNLDHLPSGIYFYRLQINDKTFTAKMIKSE